VIILLLAATLHAQLVIPPKLQGKQENQSVRELDVPGSATWTDSGLDLAAGDLVRVTAWGTIKFADAQTKSGPEGLPRGWRDLIRRFPLASANRGALLARVGEEASARVLLVGKRIEIEAGAPGRLFLGVNLDSGSTAEGSFRVKVEILERAAPPAGVEKDAKIQPASTTVREGPILGVDLALLDRLPRRVADADGTLGDMVNFLLIGPEQEVRRALEQAGWVLVNRTKKDAVVGAVLATLSKQAYVELPMSELLLFGRPQDFGFAQGEPYAVIAERHHFRLWRAPFDVNGQALWVGAGTHDVGFDRDRRTRKVTHKIDPEVDKERDFIVKTLIATGQVAQTDSLLPRKAVTQAATAHGQAYQSDGHIAVLLLRGADRDRSAQFAEIFCAVLAQRPDEGEWGACSEYLETRGKPAAPLGPLPTNYRVLVVPGVFNNCATDAPAFEQGRKYLSERGVLAELLAVPNDSSEGNGRRIAEYVLEQSRNDPRKFILVGYSKGAPDAHEAVVNDPQAARRVAAFISVAGAVGGSPIADTLPVAAQRWMDKLKMQACAGDLNAAMRSLRRDVREAFQKAHARLPVPTYSFASVAEEGRVSKALMETWKLLLSYDRRQDAQLLLPDQIVPGSIYLGAARADHFAVALPFDLSKDAQVRQMADRNRFPRSALLEALVRYAALDLEASGARQPAGGERNR
jgi:dienelactone hydrolase